MALSVVIPWRMVSEFVAGVACAVAAAQPIMQLTVNMYFFTVLPYIFVSCSLAGQGFIYYS